MWLIFRRLSAPKYAYRFLSRCYWPVLMLCVLSVLYGLWGGLVTAPADYQQGDVYRIMYVHVPLAILSLSVYMAMAISALIFLVWKIKLAELFAKVSAPIGAVFTALTLITGSIWGEPTWGTWWIWDARLTSELILLFIYLSVMAVRSAMPEPRLASRASAVVTLLGVVNIPIVHYSVSWWHTLHQGPSVLKWGTPSIAASMLHPLLAMIIAGFLYYFLYLIVQLRSELLITEKQSDWVKQLLGERHHA